MIDISLEDLPGAVSSVVLNSIAAFGSFIPSLLGGLIVLLVGLMLATAAHRIVLRVLKTTRLENLLTKYGLVQKVEGREIEWSEITAELARWSVIIVFLIPTFQSWGLGSVNVVLSRVLLYIPNVIVAAILVIIGMVFAKLAYRIAYSSSRSLGKDTSHLVGSVAQWALIIFVGFLILHQLGVAQELLRILFAGLIVMIALAGGLAFGLGGQQVARQILEAIWGRFRK